MAQEGKYLYEIEIERIQSLMGVHAINEQGLPGLLMPLGTMGIPRAYNWFSTFNTHDWLTFIDITTGLLGMIPSPAAPFLLGASLAACNADGALYFAENDPYMGGLILSFCLIPLGEFVRFIPGARNIISKGKQYCIDLLKKAKSLSGKKVLDSAEKKIVQEAELLIKELSKVSEEISKLTQKYYVSRVISNIIKTGGKLLHGTVLLLSKMSWAIGSPFVLLAGAYYTFDEIYLALYGSDEQKMKLRYNSGFQKLIRYLKLRENLETVEQQISDYFKYNLSQITKDPKKLGAISQADHDKIIKKIDSEIEKLSKQKTSSSVIYPSLDMVSSKKIDPLMNKPYTIKIGQKGQAVKTIQQMLNDLGLEMTLKKYDENSKAVDGDFGEGTYDAVIIFQSQNELNQTGEIDSETLNKLKSKFNEIQNNEE